MDLIAYALKKQKQNEPFFMGENYYRTVFKSFLYKNKKPQKAVITKQLNMNLEPLKSWISQPDVCRCCLTVNGTFDLTISYMKDGVKEVYSEMLFQCFGVSIARLRDWGPSRLICQLCVGHLRSACHFRQQVVDAQQLFTEFHLRKDLIEQDAEVKSEIEDEPNYLENTMEYNNYEQTVQTKQTEKNIVSKKSHEKRARRNKFKSAKVKKKFKTALIDVNNYDSDTPIAELTRRQKIFCDITMNKIGRHEILDKEIMTERLSNRDLEENYGAGTNNIVTKKVTKQLSERKKVMLTCHTVLKYTSACPFRHHKSWFQCFYCLKEFREIKPLRSHTSQTHSDVETELKRLKRYPRSLQIDITDLKCAICHLNFATVETLKIHFDEHHTLPIYNECIADYKVDVSPYVCHICKQEFHVFRSLTVHLNEHYANCICDVCGKSFLNSKRLKVHKRTHENGNFPCKECGKILKTKTAKANHMEKHSKRVLKCQICSKPMKHYNDRIKHMSEVHNITHKFKCNICDREYNIRHYLATHMRQTHGNKNKKCPDCNMAFITNHGLKKHMLKHSGEKPFCCNVCSKSYARSYTLKEHMRSHATE